MNSLVFRNIFYKLIWKYLWRSTNCITLDLTRLWKRHCIQRRHLWRRVRYTYLVVFLQTRFLFLLSSTHICSPFYLECFCLIGTFNTLTVADSQIQHDYLPFHPSFVFSVLCLPFWRGSIAFWGNIGKSERPRQLHKDMT